MDSFFVNLFQNIFNEIIEQCGTIGHSLGFGIKEGIMLYGFIFFGGIAITLNKRCGKGGIK